MIYLFIWLCPKCGSTHAKTDGAYAELPAVWPIRCKCNEWLRYIGALQMLQPAVRLK